MIHIKEVRIRQAAQFPAVNKDCRQMLLTRLSNQMIKFVESLSAEVFHVAFGHGRQEHYRANAVVLTQRQVIVQDFNVLCAGFGEVFFFPRVYLFASVQTILRCHKTLCKLWCHVRIVEVKRLQRQPRIQIFRSKNLFTILN